MNKFLPTISLLFILFSCESGQKEIEIVLSNTGNHVNSGTVSVELSTLDIDRSSLQHLQVIDAESNAKIPSQLCDAEKDGIYDLLLIQARVEAQSEKKLLLSEVDSIPALESKVFARFVPERTDDFAWENDRVAFRTYGPRAQHMAEAGEQGGTLSSGMDCWLKRVDYPIINKWYKKHTSGEGSYHEDTGEGLDNFHVGPSRGCGGLGVCIEEELFTSKNFTAWTILDEGPVRSRFLLEYADWGIPGGQVSETKEISIDLGSNLMKILATIEGSEMITVGLTLHENDGEIAADTVNYAFSYWQPHADSELGMGIVCHPRYYHSYTHVISGQKDKSHLLVHLKVIDGMVEYYAGFGWKESEQFKNAEEWNEYLVNFSREIQHPLLVKQP